MNLWPFRSSRVVTRGHQLNLWKAKRHLARLKTTINSMAYSTTALSTLGTIPYLIMIKSRSILIPRAETFSKSSKLSNKKAKIRKRMPSVTTQISKSSWWASWRSNSYSWSVKAQWIKMVLKSKSFKNNLARAFLNWLKKAALLCWTR